MNVPSRGYGALRVLPGDPGESVLYNKVADTGRFGGRMPPTGAISSTEIQQIETWITEGAADN